MPTVMAERVENTEYNKSGNGRRKMWEGVQKESNIQNTISLVMGGERCEGGGEKSFPHGIWP